MGPLENQQGLLTTKLSPQSVILCFLDDGHFDLGEMDSQRGFNLHFTEGSDIDCFNTHSLLAIVFCLLRMDC